MAIGWLFWSAGGVSIAQTQPDLQLPTSASAQPPPVALPPGVDDVVKLAHSGIGDEVILAKIKNDGASYKFDQRPDHLSQQGGSTSECPGRAAPRQVQQHHCYRGSRPRQSLNRRRLRCQSRDQHPGDSAATCHLRTTRRYGPCNLIPDAGPKRTFGIRAQCSTRTPKRAGPPATQPTYNWAAPAPAGQPTALTPSYAPSAAP